MVTTINIKHEANNTLFTVRTTNKTFSFTLSKQDYILQVAINSNK